LTGRSPNSLAAASIYLAADLTGMNQRTAEEIGQTCGAAENTIKQTIKLMQPQISQIEKLKYKNINATVLVQYKTNNIFEE